MLKETVSGHTETCQSVISKTTSVTLGKRERLNTQNYEELDSSFERPVEKRIKGSSKPTLMSNNCVSNPLSDKTNPKSAPTSFNGSKNLSPVLELNVKLPQG